MDKRAFLVSLAITTILQIAMVGVGHGSPAIQSFYAVGGMGFSLLGGLLYAARVQARAAPVLAISTVVGALSGLLGIALSFALGDVEAFLLIVGTLGSAFAGLVGGAGGRAIKRAGTSGKSAE